ncbi:unnamed protein product [Chondrus crispus]|uniref:Uncharacterized protein n=1 Tax=Chondrus crispus TaxID=2769 RepID=R7QMR5_CHOCR|nr:unnamed protein product [Chondrus crispus]CDF39038.1 unnamed protein product [Chondrus crispus]|eukprot:XP_005718943.1 unnamed protein product [Chondrus crispus]
MDVVVEECIQRSGAAEVSEKTGPDTGPVTSFTRLD